MYWQLYKTVDKIKEAEETAYTLQQQINFRGDGIWTYFSWAVQRVVGPNQIRVLTGAILAVHYLWWFSRGIPDDGI